MKLKEITIRILLVFISTAFSLLFAEIGIRYYLYGEKSLSYSWMKSVQLTGIGRSEFIKKAENIDVLYDLKVNIDGRYNLTSFQTNSRGLRDKEYSLEKPDSVLRVAVIGDSFTMGSGVELEQVYHSQLEQMLNDSGRQTYEFINFGVGGYNLLNYKGVLKDKVLKWKPDIVLVGYCSYNDHLLPRKQQLDGNIRLKSRKNGFLNSYLLSMLKRPFRDNRRAEKQLDITEENELFITRFFEELHSLSQAFDFQPVVAFLSLSENDPRTSLIQQLASEAGVEFLMAASALDADKTDQYWLNILDQHPNAFAHRAYAEAMINYFRKAASQDIP